MFFFPIICPHCFEKVFFFQQEKIYGVANSIDEKIHYHLCPFILGKEYWKKKNLQLCLDLQKKNLDFYSISKQFQPSFSFRKTTTIPQTAILLSFKKKESYDQLYCCGLGFYSFFLLSSQKMNWKIGSLLKIEPTKILKDKKTIAQVIEIKKKEICQEKNNQNIFCIQLSGEDLSLLEKAEKMFLKTSGQKK